MDDRGVREQELADEVERLRERLALYESAGTARPGLSEMERRGRGGFEALPQISWINRPDGAVEVFNHRWTQFTGLGVRPVETEWVEAFHPEDRARLLAAREAAPSLREARPVAVARGEPYQVHLGLRRADGVYRWQERRIVPPQD